MIHPAVLAKWHQFSEPLEGRVHSMYLDIKGLVTTGVGNLIDSVTEAQKLPWKHADARLASKDEVAAAWRELKSRQDLSRLHWKYAASLNDLRLTDADIDALVESKLHSNERELRKAYPNWDDFPADAQLGCLSMAWAVGPGFPRIFANFSRYAVQQDWGNAKLCATIKTAGNPGVIPRNENNEICFGNAAIVVQYALDRSVLHWPDVARPEARPVEPVPDTERDPGAEALALSVAARSAVDDVLDEARREMTTDGEE
jgi:hypothetical protein